MGRGIGSKATLKIAEAVSVDVGRGIARIDPEVEDKLGITNGDAIEILGKRRTFALCWKAHRRDAGKRLIRIDGYIRDNAGVSVDKKLIVRKITAKNAQSVTLAPTVYLKIAPSWVGGLKEYVKSILIARIVSRGDSCPMRIKGRVVNFIITDFKPMDDAVVVNEDTSVKIDVKGSKAIKRP